MKRFKLLLIAGVLSAAVLSCDTAGQEDDIESSITEIEVTAIRTVYGLGETIDPASIEVTATSDSGTGPFAITAAHLSPAAAIDTASASVPITITVNGHAEVFNIAVFPVVSKSIGGDYTGYDDLDAAFANPADRDTITLYANQTIGNGKNPEGKTVTLKGYGSERKITHDSPGKMFTLSGAGTVLILGENITLDGEDKNNAGDSLVKVNSGAILCMKDGSTITGGKNSNIGSSGGGVFVGDNGTFNMEGGTIRGNEAGYSGGGVYVESMEGSTFNMSGGTISGNEGHYGGGVYVGSNSTFTMTGGTISGNEVSNIGGGVYVGSNGTFTYNDGTFTGNTATGGGNAVYKGSYGTIDGDGGVNVGTGGGGVGFDVFPPQ